MLADVFNAGTGDNERTSLKIEERHAEDGRKICSWEKQGAHERYSFHGCAVPLARVSDSTLLSGNFEIEPGFPLRHDVVQL